MRRLLLALTAVFLSTTAALAASPTNAASTASAANAAWIWPVDGKVITPYSNGTDPYATGQHRGIDIAAPVGTTVRAAAAGEVRFAGTAGSSGLTIGIRTGDGYDTSYLHLSSLAVRAGTRVSAGDRIGAVGTTGTRSATAPHLHFGVRDAGTRFAYHDPLDFLPPQAGPAPAPDPPAAAPAPAPAPRAPVAAPIRAPLPRGAPVPRSAPVPFPSPAPAPRGLPGRDPPGVPGRAPRALRRRAPKEVPHPLPVPGLAPNTLPHGAPLSYRAATNSPASAHSPASVHSLVHVHSPGGAHSSATAHSAARPHSLAPGSPVLRKATQPPSAPLGADPARAAKPQAPGPDIGWALACAGLLLAAAILGLTGERGRERARTRSRLAASLRPLVGRR
jgi:hypothetical protein